MPRIYLAKAPDDYVKNVSQLSIGSTAVYYIIKTKHNLNGKELHIVREQPNGNPFQPDLEGTIIKQYSPTVDELFDKYKNNLNAIGMKAGSKPKDFIAFINQNISKNPVSGKTDIWAVEFKINPPSKHHYKFQRNGKLQRVPIIADI